LQIHLELHILRKTVASVVLNRSKLFFLFAFAK